MNKWGEGHRQQGLTVVGWLVILVVVMVLGSAGIKVIPAYIEFNTISGIIQRTLQDSKVSLKSENEILSDIGRRFYVNTVKSIEPRDLLVTKEPSGMTVTVDYEVRENLFGNIDLVVVFFKEFSKDGSQ